MSQLLTRVGPLNQADGASPAIRSDRETAVVVQQSHGKYTEAARRGGLWSAASGGLIPGTAIGTTAAFSLYNPSGSGVDLVITKVSVGYDTGTIGSGTLWHCTNGTPSQAAPTGAALTAKSTNAGNNATAKGVAKGNATTVLPTVSRPICTLSPMLATSVVGLQQIVDDVDGEIVVKPGCSYQIQATATAGTTPTLNIGVVWEEVPATV